MTPIEFSFGGPPSPEQRAQADRDALAERARAEALARAALPVLAEARRAVHELFALGLSGDYLTKASKSLALLDDALRLNLVRRPPEPTP